MKELTTGDKATIVLLLERHYAIKEKRFIDAIASNEEERLNLTLIAYVIGAERKNTQTNVSTKTSVVVINRLYSILEFVRAIREAKNLSLKEAKDYADHILIVYEGAPGQFYSKPFMVGEFKDSIFTLDQWEKICASLGDTMKWQYV